LAAEAFTEQVHDIAVGVFYSWGEEYWGWSNPDDEWRTEARTNLEDHLTVQVQAFIALLRDQGIL